MSLADEMKSVANTALENDIKKKQEESYKSTTEYKEKVLIDNYLNVIHSEIKKASQSGKKYISGVVTTTVHMDFENCDSQSQCIDRFDNATYCMAETYIYNYYDFVFDINDKNSISEKSIRDEIDRFRDWRRKNKDFTSDSIRITYCNKLISALNNKVDVHRVASAIETALISEGFSASVKVVDSSFGNGWYRAREKINETAHTSISLRSVSAHYLDIEVSWFENEAEERRTIEERKCTDHAFEAYYKKIRDNGFKRAMIALFLFITGVLITVFALSGILARIVGTFLTIIIANIPFMTDPYQNVDTDKNVLKKKWTEDYEKGNSQ